MDKHPLLNSTQLELELDDVRLKVPWNGRSPRGLTRGSQVVILKAQAGKGRPQTRMPAQRDLFEDWQSGPCYTGAGTLLPLPGRMYRG